MPMYWHFSMLLISNPNKEFENYFLERITNINTSLQETKGYIAGIFNGFLRINNNDLSKDSITLKYIEAKKLHSFVGFQNLGDWIFLIRTTFPESLNASEEYYDSVAKCSYYKCYVILDRKWRCFEEMADRLEYFIETITLPSSGRKTV